MYIRRLQWFYPTFCPPYRIFVANFLLPPVARELFGNIVTEFYDTPKRGQPRVITTEGCLGGIE